MHLAHLRLRDFRNYQLLDTDFTPGFHLLLGRNAQGKTNILEAIHLLANLRSFRGVGNSAMVQHEKSGWFVGGKAVGTGSHEVKMYWSAKERQLSLNGQAVQKLSDYLGTLRTVAFTSEDLALVKGVGRSRRRYMDFLLVQTVPTYLSLLQRYTRALRNRNALLKKKPIDKNALDSFTMELVKIGNEIIRHRTELIPQIGPSVTDAHRRIAPAGEDLSVEYTPSVKSDFCDELKHIQDRELKLGSTTIGPHRDELALMLHDKPASDFASEGQERAAAIAQAEHLTNFHGSPPVLLIDDVMGELDIERRKGFLPLMESCSEGRGQIFMTCTEENWPSELSSSMQRWEVINGTIHPTS